MYCAIFRDICYSTRLTVSESHRGPGKVLGVKEVEGGLALNLGGDVARHSGDPVVSVDDAAIREVAGQVLVLDSLDQAQPWGVPQGPQQVIDIYTNINFLSILHVQF